MNETSEASPATLPRTPRSVADVLRRGLDSTIANWQLLLLRLAETMLIGLLALAGVVAIIVPILVSIGLSRIDLKNADNAAELLTAILVQHWIVLVYILVAITLALTVVIGVHAFVAAGVARIFVNAERAAGRAGTPRQRFAVFSIEQWAAGGRDAWWPVFWIYNIAYGVASIIVMVPLIPLGLLIVFTQGAPAALVVSCLGLIVLGFITIIVLVVTNIVCQKAIVLVVQRPIDATTALRVAWRAMRNDFARHFGVAFIMMVLTVGGTGVLAALSFGFAAPGSAAPFAMFLFMPVRLAISFASSVYSAAVSNWFIASFAALTVEGA